MEWKQGAALPDEYIFTNKEKRAISPDNIHKYFCMMAYGKENPAPEDNPSLARLSTLIYWKKEISYFMDTNEQWNESHKSGNPTRSQIINRLLGAICWKETQGVGKACQSDHPFTDNEMEQVLDGF